MKSGNSSEDLNQLKLQAYRLHPLNNDVVSIEIIDLIRQISQRFNSVSSQVGQDFGLFSMEAEILILLVSATNKSLSPKHLIKSTQLSSGAMTAALNRLLKKDFIQRVKDSEDGRILHAKLKVKGEEIAGKLIEERLNFSDRLLKLYDELESRQFRRLLSKLFEGEF